MSAQCSCWQCHRVSHAAHRGVSRSPRASNPLPSPSHPSGLLQGCQALLSPWGTGCLRDVSAGGARGMEELEKREMEPVAAWPVIPWRWDPAVLHGSWHCPRVAPGPGVPQAGHLVTPPGVTQRGSEPETFFDSQQGQIFEGTAPKTPEAEAVVPPGPLTEARLATELWQHHSFIGQSACRWHRR